MRCALRRSADGSFAVPLYDGARRFDILGHILPKKDASEGTLRVELTLRAIAGFKGESTKTAIPTTPRAKSTCWSQTTRA